MPVDVKEPRDHGGGRDLALPWIKIQDVATIGLPASSQVAPKMLVPGLSSEERHQRCSVTCPRSPSIWQSRGSNLQIYPTAASGLQGREAGWALLSVTPHPRVLPSGLSS